VYEEDPKEKPPPPKQVLPAEHYRALTLAYEASREGYFKALLEAKTNEERQRAEKLNQQAYDYLVQLAQKNPKDPVAVDALIWVVEHDPFSEPTTQALTLLTEEYSWDRKVERILSILPEYPSPGRERLLQAVRDRSPYRDVQAKACYYLAMCLKYKSEMARSLKDPELGKPIHPVWFVHVGREYVNELKESGPDRYLREAEALFEQAIEKNGSLKLGEAPLAEAARTQLFEIQHLTIGKVAPEIEGEDVGGRKFRLSDYRGKVVVLDFWGHW
jgi:AhpC/TSA family